MERKREAIRLFYSYAHEDEKVLDARKDGLVQLKRRGVINDWHYRQIEPGQD
jgi:hypothetical protein